MGIDMTVVAASSLRLVGRSFSQRPGSQRRMNSSSASSLSSSSVMHCGWPKHITER
jgi:hypothetical protein